MHLQVRNVDGSVFWVEAHTSSTVASIKRSIQEQCGIDVVMQKLICTGKLLSDDMTPELSGISERDFLVLVTSKPRPPSLMTTGAPLPPSSQYVGQFSRLTVGGEEREEADGGEEGEGEEAADLSRDVANSVDEADSVSRLVQLGFGANQAEEALQVRAELRLHQ